MPAKKLTEVDVTDEALFLRRRKIIQSLGILGAFSGISIPSLIRSADANYSANQFMNLQHSVYSTNAEPADFEDITTYNNFYEFGTSKASPSQQAQQLKTTPWDVTVEGEVEKPGLISMEDILGTFSLEERIYRLRCVEAWSMVIPWVGIPLKSVLQRFQPTSKAKFVEFTTLYDPSQMPGQNSAVLSWPYVEALRIDEAVHPLTILAVGLYGKVLPNQNGAPLRLVVPWKYGFKSIKSIVKIRLTETQPITTWNKIMPSEYGFYANVNPKVDHPRWSQAYERVIGASIFSPKRETEPFNGYADEVAHLYQGMNLRKFF